MSMLQPASDAWEAVYYPNPIPLSSRCLAAAALLFDRLHIPGVTIPQARISDDVKPSLKRELLAKARDQATHNLVLWSLEQPALSDFIHLPDHPFAVTMKDDQLTKIVEDLLDDTYGAGTSPKVHSVVGGTIFPFPNSESHVLALTWPFYQARALQYSYVSSLPLFSDDLTIIPPLPRHPSEPPDTKALAQQLAVQAVSLVLPPLRSVDPVRVSEFRAAVGPLSKPFRTEMVKLTAELRAAMTSGENDSQLTKLCRNLVEAKVLPAVDELSRQLSQPVKAWSKIALEVTEAGLAAYGSTISTELTVAWAILRGAKIASEYVQLYVDRQGKKRSGLSYLLNIHDQLKQSTVSEWDTRDWRCSGSVYISDPGAPIAQRNRPAVKMARKGFNLFPMTLQRVEQTGSQSVLWLNGRLK